MANSDYADRWAAASAALKQQTAQDPAAGAFPGQTYPGQKIMIADPTDPNQPPVPPSQQGVPAGAFDTQAPPMPGPAPQGALPPPDAATPPVNPGAPGAIATAEPPLTHDQLWAKMPDEVKTKILDQVEKSGVDVNHLFDSKVKTGEIQVDDADVKKPLTKEQKLEYISEVALRTASNLNRPGLNGFGDFADAKLATDARRSAIAQAEQDKQEAEQARAQQNAILDQRQKNLLDRQDRSDVARETRADIRQVGSEKRQQERLDAEAKLKAQEGNLDRASREKIANIQASGEGRKGAQIQIGDDGVLNSIVNGKATPVTHTVDGKEVPFTVKDKKFIGLTEEKAAELAEQAADNTLKDSKSARELRTQMADELKDPNSAASQAGIKGVHAYAVFSARRDLESAHTRALAQQVQAKGTSVPQAAAPPPTSGKIAPSSNRAPKEGDIIANGKGQRMVRKGDTWQPLQ